MQTAHYFLNIPREINKSWKIKKTASAYNNKPQKCKLALEGEISIITFPDQHKLVNKHSELISK